GEGALLVVPIGLSWVVSQRGPRAALASLWPVLAVGCVYGVLYTLGGYGARGSGLYLSPLSAEFFAQLPQRWLGLVADLLGSVANDAAMLGAAPVQTLWGLVALAPAGLVLTLGLTD